MGLRGDPLKDVTDEQQLFEHCLKLEAQLKKARKDFKAREAWYEENRERIRAFHMNETRGDSGRYFREIQ